MRNIIIASAVFAGTVAGKNLAPTPPMGWMSWERFRCEINCTAFPDDCISEKLYLEQAQKTLAYQFKGMSEEVKQLESQLEELKKKEEQILKQIEEEIT